MSEPIYCDSCKKKLGDYLEGIYVTICPKCQNLVIVDRRKNISVR